MVHRSIEVKALRLKPSKDFNMIKKRIVKDFGEGVFNIRLEDGVVVVSGDLHDYRVRERLIKIITGIYHADAGELLLDDQPIQVANPVDGQGYGLAAIYQEPMVYPDLNVAENIFISHRNQGFIVNWRKMYRDAEEILGELDVKLDVRMPARGLTLASQQTIEI